MKNSDKILIFGLCVFAATLPLSIAAVNFGWAAALLAVLLHPAWRAGVLSRCVKNELFWPWVIYLSALILSAIFGVNFKGCLKMFHSDLSKAVIYFALLAAIPASQALGHRPFSLASHWYAGGAAAAALLGLGQILFHRGQFALPGQMGMAHGTMHHVTYGELLSLAMCFSFCSFLFCSDAAVRKWWAASLGVLGAALVLSQARGAWLASLAIFLTAAAVYAPARKTVLVLCAAGLLALAGVFALGSRVPAAGAIKARVLSIFSTKQQANETRLLSWKVGTQIFQDYPVFGVGAGNLRDVFHNYYSQPVDGESNWGNLHNLYMQQLVERGIVGLAALLFLFFSMAKLAWKRFQESPSAWRLCALAMLSGLWVMDVTETSFQHAIISITVSWFLVLAQIPEKIP